MRKMKNSFEQWLGELPVSWGLSRIASLYKIRNTKVSDKDYMPLSVTRGNEQNQDSCATIERANGNIRLS